MSMEDAARQRTDRRRQVTGAVVTLGGLVLIGVAAVVAWAWRADLPDPIATHWGVGGVPDGFSALGPFLGAVLGIGAVLVLGFGGITWLLGNSSVTRRIGAASTVWVALFISIVVLGALSAQRGLADARAADGVDGVLLIAVFGSLVPAVIAAVLVPGDVRQPTDRSVDSDAPRVTLAPGERATWIGRVSSPVAFVITVPVLLLMVGLAVATRAWALLAVDVVLVVLLATLSSFLVRVDAGGLTVRSSIGWPSYRVRLDEIVRADVTQVSPVKEFGGWGWRVGRDGRVGVVLRKGEALRVQQTGGRSLVVTVDGAATAAGLINTLADRERPPR